MRTCNRTIGIWDSGLGIRVPEHDDTQVGHAAEMCFVGWSDEDPILELECRRSHDEIVGWNQLAAPTEVRVEIHPSLRLGATKIDDGHALEQRIDRGTPHGG